MQLFFEQTEQGFQNYLVVRMYCRIFEPDKIIVNFNKSVDEVYFIKQGQVRVFDKTGSNDFLILPQKSWFGDFQVILQLRSSFCFRAYEGDQNVVCMCVDAQTLEDAFSLFPRSKYPLLKRSLQRRKAFMDQYQQLQDKMRSDLIIKKEQLKEVKTQMLKGQVNSMFQENLSAKMKQIRDKHKLFDREREASIARNNQRKLMAEAQSEKEVQRVMTNLANVGMKNSLLDDRQAPPQVSTLKMRKTLNLSKTLDEFGVVVDPECEMVTELEELCDFTEVEIGEFDEI